MEYLSLSYITMVNKYSLAINSLNINDNINYTNIL